MRFLSGWFNLTPGLGARVANLEAWRKDHEREVGVHIDTLRDTAKIAREALMIARDASALVDQVRLVANSNLNVILAQIKTSSQEVIAALDARIKPIEARVENLELRQRIRDGESDG